MKYHFIIFTVIVLAAAAIYMVKQSEYAAIKEGASAKILEGTPEEKEEVKKSASLEKGCEEFPEKLRKCEEYSCIMGHPSSDGGGIHHSVKGLDKDGRCIHVQKTSDGNIECHYDEKIKEIIIKSFGSDEKISDADAKALGDAFETSCTVN